MDEQDAVAAFVAEHDLAAPPAYRLLDLVSEVGELAKAANESTGYGEESAEVGIGSDEIGDALFALLALSESLDVDAAEALEGALAKYEERLESDGTAASGS